ncbi:hypothetical protein K0U83_07320 [bacterium]|jgi:hypothetical protein|nr:hypothetical protein [bacterium]
MFCYAVFHHNKQLRVFPYDSTGDDWKRARILAIKLAETGGDGYSVEHFGVSGVGTVVWK